LFSDDFHCWSFVSPKEGCLLSFWHVRPVLTFPVIYLVIYCFILFLPILHFLFPYFCSFLSSFHILYFLSTSMVLAPPPPINQALVASSHELPCCLSSLKSSPPPLEVQASFCLVWPAPTSNPTFSHILLIALMMKAVMSLNFYHTTQCNIPEDSHLEVRSFSDKTVSELI
jgi:hypothetical protein